nr:C-terminal binding protein [Arthrobacter ruber]
MLEGSRVTLESRPCAEPDEIIARCADADGLVVMNEPITRTVLELLPRLKIIARPGVGVDSIDIDAATELGIQVTNVRDGNYMDVATHALALILGGIRKIRTFDAQVRGGHWNGSSAGTALRRPSHLRLGIIGYGRSGQHLAKLAAPLGFSILACSPRTDFSVLTNPVVRPLGFDELISTSDVVSLHLPLTAETTNLISKDTLSRFKRGSYLVNVARGGIIDERALAEAISEGQLSGAGLDVFSKEPLPEDSPLHAIPEVTLTPHVAYLTAESLNEVRLRAFTDVSLLLDGKQVTSPVNTPKSNPLRWRNREPQ